MLFRSTSSPNLRYLIPGPDAELVEHVPDVLGVQYLGRPVEGFHHVYWPRFEDPDRLAHAGLRAASIPCADY